MSKSAGPILSVLVNTYKRVPEPYYVTQCISQLIDAVIARELAHILDSMIEPLLTALFTQVLCSLFVATCGEVDRFGRQILLHLL